MRTYAEMVARTTTMEAHLQGTALRLQENGHDLVKVSTHSGTCEKCAPWQGKVLSLSGNSTEYPSLQEAKEAGLFHPRCRHAYGLYIDLDEETNRVEGKNNPQGQGGNSFKQYDLKGAKKDVNIFQQGNINIVVPVDLDKSKQHFTVDDIKQTLQPLPSALTNSVNEIQLLDYRNPDDLYWEQKYNIPGFRSFATGGNGIIHFYDNSDMSRATALNELSPAITHEMGHNLDQILGNGKGLNRLSSSSEWTQAMTSDYIINKQEYVSTYASMAKSQAEDFADSVRLLVNNQQQFEQKFPNRANILKKVIVP